MDYPRQLVSATAGQNLQSTADTASSAAVQGTTEEPSTPTSSVNQGPPSITVTSADGKTGHPAVSYSRMQRSCQVATENGNHLCANTAWQQTAQQTHKQNIRLEHENARLKAQNESLTSMLFGMNNAFNEMDQNKQIEIQREFWRLQGLNWRK
jgi:hypothetical protein